MMQQMGGFLSNLTRIQKARSARVSSWDQTGRNLDYWMIPPGETMVLADLEGPGCITHIWMTQFCRRALGPSIIDPSLNAKVAPVNEIHNALGITWEKTDPDYYRKVLFKIYWDDQKWPSVLVPLGDFFCIGHSMPGNFASLPFTVSVRPEEELSFGGSAALNCYLPMPFNKRARIEVENQNDVPYGQYFHIDYELYAQPLGDDIAYLHAQWRRQNPCDGWGPDLQVNSPEVNKVANLDGKGNYVLLETEGTGHYIGCNLSVTHFQGSWWGEGDEMIFIDGEDWPPSIHGTGTEDYFNHAWGMQKNAFPMHGSIIHESDVPGYAVCYRFHLTDPIRFTKSIKVTIEHGHANHLSDDWASTAYWYQKLPSKPFGILPVEKRLPIHPDELPKYASQGPTGELNDEMWQARIEAQQRKEQYLKERERELQKKVELSRKHSEENTNLSRAIRNSIK